MKSVGEIIKDARQKKKLSRKKLESITKIKSEFIEDLENSNWSKLPEYPVLLGFIKNIASALDLETKHLAAILRRDYPSVKLKVNPNPEIKEKFKWSPKTTFIAGIVVVLLVIFSYLGFSYFKFITPPYLQIQEPYENQVVEKAKLKVIGKTDSEAFVDVNNQPVIVADDGYFETELEISEETEEITVTAKFRSGRETVVHRKIVVDLGEP